jgi:hypothetical protein
VLNSSSATQMPVSVYFEHVILHYNHFMIKKSVLDTMLSINPSIVEVIDVVVVFGIQNMRYFITNVIEFSFIYCHIIDHLDLIVAMKL